MKRNFFIILLTILFICILSSTSLAFSPSDNNLFNGIDISSYQKLVDFNKIKQQGFDFVYIKASEGTTYVNPYLDISYQNAKSNNMKIGFYHYVSARNVNQAIAEANFFVNTIKGKSFECKLAMDFEDFGTLSKKEINDISKAFLTTLEKSTSTSPLLYSNTFSARTIFDSSLNIYSLWIAEYGVSSPSPNGKWNNWSGWQYSSRGQLSGVQGFVDLNKFTNSVLLNSPFVPPDNNTIKYTIQRGDTLSAIASRFNTSVDTILAYNPYITNANLIYPGNILVLPNSSLQTYIVQKGDTLSKISKQFTISVDTLVRINNISNPNLIYPGQRLIVSDNSSIIGCLNINYRIKYGDTLSSISRKYKTSVSNILSLNESITNPNVIFANQVILVPDCTN